MRRKVRPGNGCKLMFTARFFDVCSKTKAQKDIKEYCLKLEKSREKFQEMVGEETLGDHPNIPRLAERVVEECKGFPLALITQWEEPWLPIRNLKNGNLQLRVLRESAGGSTFTGMGLDKEMYDV